MITQNSTLSRTTASHRKRRIVSDYSRGLAIPKTTGDRSAPHHSFKTIFPLKTLKIIVSPFLSISRVTTEPAFPRRRFFTM